MHRPMIAAAVVAAVVATGCATEPYSMPVFSYVTTYYDRNGDGRADYEDHDDPRISDEAWALSDTDFDGYYDRKINFGVSLTRESIHQPVPRNVKLRRKLPARMPTG